MFAKNIKLNMVFQYIDRLNAPERMGKQILFFRYITKKSASLSEKGCACSFWAQAVFFTALYYSFLKKATTTAPGPTWVPITLPTVV